MLSIFHLLDIDLGRVSSELTYKVNQAPDFFQNMPVIIDLQTVSERDDLPSFSVLVELLLEHGLVPVGVRNGSEAQHQAAIGADLALLRERGGIQNDQQPSRQTKSVQKRNAESDRTIRPAPQRSKLVVRPVRSGQQVYAVNGDLVVIAPVSVGSELLADGCIHVYGPLRGRALAGMNGDESARIFCQSLEAELIAIAGHYQINEELASELKGKPAQIWLENQRLMISPI